MQTVQSESTSTFLERLDAIVARILFIKPQAAAVNANQSVKTAERAFGYSLLLSAVRCIIKYVLLPFVLPLIGIAGGLATGITLLINVIAILSLVASVRTLWRINYSRKWSYLAVAVAAMIFISFFILFDLNIIS
ncbi:MAG: hypothetical protein KF726_11790 [Anaerolineae bacterium]|nr:hypothetical protein [Anaerolineae bacterium]